MTETKVRAMLVSAILVMSTVPPLGALYFLDRAVQTSLDLGFNPRIARGLDIGAESLKTLRRLDPPQQDQYRAKFETIEELRRIYSQPEWLKAQVVAPLRIYVGIGLTAVVLVAVLIATLLSRGISMAYRNLFSELLAERDRVRYLQQMASWQELARALAHEIKNPLTPVEVLLSSLGRAYAEKSPEQFRHQLSDTQEMIAEELSHLKRTVARFSEFARLPKPDLLEHHPVDVVGKHIQALQASFPDASIILNPEEQARDARVKMDSSLFRQVLMNVINNGVEANRGRAVTFTVRISAQTAWVHIDVANDGVPVTPSIATRLFEPYVSERRAPDNMGLGLAIAKKIVSEHNGSMEYAEVAGHPTFKIMLPRVN